MLKIIHTNHKKNVVFLMILIPPISTYLYLGRLFLMRQKKKHEGYGSAQIPIYVTSGELKQEPVVCTPTNNDASSQTKRKNKHYPLTEQQFSPHAPGTSRIQGNHQRHPTGQVQIGSPSRRTNGHRVLRGAVAKDHDSKASSCDKPKHLGAVIAASDEYPWPGHMPWQQKNMLSRQQMVLEALDS